MKETDTVRSHCRPLAQLSPAISNFLSHFYLRKGGFEPRDFGFRTQGWDAIITCDEIADIKPIVDVEDPERQIECPSMIFCYLPDTGTRLYENVKTICDFYPGVNSQCIVQAKVRSQTRGTEQ